MRRSWLVVALGLLALLWWRVRIDSRERGAGPAGAVANDAEHASSVRELAQSLPPGEIQRLPESGRESVARPSPEENGIVLAGHVLECAAGAPETAGVPAGGVTVRVGAAYLLEGLGYGGNGVPEGPSTRTGPDGAFRFVLPDDGQRPLRFVLSVDEEGRFLTTSIQGMLEVGETRLSDLRLVCYAHGDLAGRTLDLLGRPVPGVEVALWEWPEESPEPPRTTVHSDKEGRFVFASVSEMLRLEAHKPGYALIECLPPTQAENGVWEPLDLVLAPSGRLILRLTDPMGEPVSGVRVNVAIAVPERAWNFGRSMRKSPSARTDESGVAVVESVWAQQRLRVELQREDQDWAVGGFERVDAKGALPEGAEDGLPLVLEPGSTRTLEVELAVRTRLVGRVRTEWDEALPDPWVWLQTLDRPKSAPGALTCRVRGDAEGRFDLEMCSLRSLGPLLVSVTDADSRFGPRPVVQLCASAVVELTGRAGEPEEIMLVLQPALAIGGRIVSDRPSRHLVRITARESPLPFGISPSGTERLVFSKENGEFRFDWLARGRYDLEIEPREVFPVVWLRGVEAGTEDLAIPLSGEKAARVTVHVTLAGGELDEATLLTCRLRPHGATPEVPQLPRLATLSELSGWPPVSHVWSGDGAKTDALGWTNYSTYALGKKPRRVVLDEGLVWIGAKARAKDGNWSVPIGTGLVRLGAGEHELFFELAPSGSVEGQVCGQGARPELFVALARAGELLELDVRRDELGKLCELGADGFFRFPLVPVGTLELRVGTKTELLAGRWTHREALELARGATLVCDVHL